jgi:gliding motility-associated-like protein
VPGVGLRLNDIPALFLENQKNKSMRRIRNIATALMMIAGIVGVNAQPSWNVNPGNYQYSMTIVAFLNVNDRELVGAHDKVAAFVNGEVRGVASPAFAASANRHLAYLTIFANKEKEKVAFKIFDSTTGNVADIGRTIDFKIDAQHGNAFRAFSIANPPLNTEAAIKDFKFTGLDSVSTKITGQAVDIMVEFDQDRHQLIPEFVLSEGGKMFLDRQRIPSGEITTDFSEPVIYSVLSEDESQLKAYTIKVSNRTVSDSGFSCTNVITANNDGANDFWMVTDAFKYRNAEFRILDANGRVLYESIGYNNDWNGYYNGDKLSRGKYYYVIKDPDTNTFIQGDILVLY